MTRVICARSRVDWHGTKRTRAFGFTGGERGTQHCWLVNNICPQTHRATHIKPTHTKAPISCVSVTHERPNGTYTTQTERSTHKEDVCKTFNVKDGERSRTKHARKHTKKRAGDYKRDLRQLVPCDMMMMMMLVLFVATIYSGPLLCCMHTNNPRVVDFRSVPLRFVCLLTQIAFEFVDNLYTTIYTCINVVRSLQYKGKGN